MKKNIIMFIVSCAMFMEAVDTTILNTAIPVMAHSLEVNPIDLKLALISYLLSLAIFIPISGWIADKYGVKKVFIAAIGVFTLSSLWCGFTQSLWELVLARIIQSVGGSLTVPVGRLIILRTCERHELITKMSIVVMIASLGMLLGPLLGGIITDYFSWRWIFWVNIPVGIIAMLLSHKLLPTILPRSVPPLDKSGFIMFGAGLAFLTLGLSLFSETKADIVYSASITLLSALLLIGYTKHSRNKNNPIIKVTLLNIRTFRIAVLGNLLTRLSFGGIPFLLPLLFQIILEYSPQLSGMLLTPVALGVFLVKPLSFSILRRLGYKKLLLLNTVLVCFSLWSFATINQSTSVIYIGFLTFLYGFFIALQYTGMNSLAYANIDDNDMSYATSIMSTVQQLSQSFGVAISALLVSLFTFQVSQHFVLTVKIFHLTFFALGILTILSGLIFTSLKKEDGKELIESPT
ncbi:TPA: MFS transporter [Legionella pneumophila]|nr:MFS transporter [Legionella pneumophila]HEM0301637.1 MFS transporter [Legionella pneumophila]